MLERSSEKDKADRKRTNKARNVTNYISMIQIDWDSGEPREDIGKWSQNRIRKLRQWQMVPEKNLSWEKMSSKKLTTKKERKKKKIIS